MMINKIIVIIVLAIFVSCNQKEQDNTSQEVDTFLSQYMKDYQQLFYEAAKAEWKANTYIMENDTITEKLVQETGEALSKFSGSKEVIEKTKKFLSSKEKLNDLQIRQLNAILYAAGRNPEIAGDAVKELIAANAKQTKDLYGYAFKINGKEVSPNEIDKILTTSNDLNERLAAWNASKEIGKNLKDGLDNLKVLRNKTVQALEYKNFFAYEASAYGFSVDELRDVCQTMIKDLWPLYRELHTWARYELATKYKTKEVPEYLPAHWLPNRWGQEWNDMVEVEGVDLDKKLADYNAEWIVKKGEEFYVSMGFPKLPKSFYDSSSLYPLPIDSPFKKNNHASAWHLDYDKDIRSLMSVEPNTKWWSTTLHELGHIYYYISYSNPEVPLILREGANRAYHEGIGTMIGLASMQLPFLQGLGLVEQNTKVDEIQLLLKEALEYIVVIPWGAGVMTDFEWELYNNNLQKDQFNKKWWELVKKYQGIVPPTDRGEEYCDAASKTHINNDAAQYYDYAISNLLLFQIHNYIAKNILKQNPRATNYWGNKEIGDFLQKLMKPGASVDWKDHLKNTIGEEVSAKGMLEYFAPLESWLKEKNKGRKHTLPESL